MTATALRLTRLHLASRRVPGSLLALAGLAAALRIAAHWTPAGGSYAVAVPLIVAAAAAAVIGVTTRSPMGVTTRSPIGEPERAAGRWLPAHDRGAAICAALVLAVGVAAVALRGALESERP